ncbi:MAG: uracil-DNA glycosylase [Polyangiaceae bacterium]|nr:uracil-DNA glycosylase [Polyangiaceae bacterium]
MPDSEPDVRAELKALSLALAAHADILQATGVQELPADPERYLPNLGDGPLPKRPQEVGVAIDVVSESPSVAKQAPAAELPAASAASALHDPEGPSGPAHAAPPARDENDNTKSSKKNDPVAPPTAPSAPARQAISEDAALRLPVLAEEVTGCTRCALHEHRQQTVFARGTGKSGICFIGEGPGADEDAQGSPFVGKAGQLLDKMIDAMGIDRDDVYVCNVVKCRPPENRKPLPEEMAACIPYLNEQLELIRPQVIVALGGTAVQGLLDTKLGITRLRGTWKLYQGRIPVMPTFHPAYLLRQPSAKAAVWQDLQAVLEHIGRTVPAKKPRQ